jgi:hypothetical protein
MYPEAAYISIFDKLREAPPSPDDAWHTDLARLLFQVDMSIEGKELRVSPGGFSYLEFHLPGERGIDQPATVESMLDHIVDNHLGTGFFTPAGFRFWELTHGEMLAWRLYGTPKAPRFWNAPPDSERKETPKVPEMV